MTEPPPPDTLLIRAVLGDDVGPAEFDAWYRDLHLPEAVRRLGARRASRWWSRGEEARAVHYALYEFDDPAELERALSSPEIAALIADFSETWGRRVARVRARAVMVQRVERAE